MTKTETTDFAVWYKGLADFMAANQMPAPAKVVDFAIGKDGQHGIAKAISDYNTNVCTLKMQDIKFKVGVTVDGVEKMAEIRLPLEGNIFAGIFLFAALTQSIAIGSQ